MNAKETKTKMDREVKLRTLLVKLNREFSRVQETVANLQRAVYNESTVKCTIELEDESCSTQMITDADGFHGKSYSDYQKSCLADTVLPE
jgi:hypothetical protein